MWLLLLLVLLVLLVSCVVAPHVWFLPAKIATLRTTAGMTGMPCKKLHLRFNADHTKLAVVAQAGGAGGVTPHARVTVLWVPQRRSANHMADVEAASSSSSSSPLSSRGNSTGGPLTYQDNGIGIGANPARTPANDGSATPERSDDNALVLAATVVDACWHPAAVDTLVALSQGGKLQLFRLDRGGAELQFKLQATYSPTPLALSAKPRPGPGPAAPSPEQRPVGDNVTAGQNRASASCYCAHFSFGTTAPRAAFARVAARAQAICQLWGGEGDAAYLRAHAHQILGVAKHCTAAVRT